MIHKTDDGTFVVSSKSSWIPGCFDSERAAKYAFRFTIFQLQKLQNEKNKTSGVITFKDLQELKQNHKTI